MSVQAVASLYGRPIRSMMQRCDASAHKRDLRLVSLLLYCSCMCIYICNQTVLSSESSATAATITYTGNQTIHYYH
jgi:hypothetical protein